MFVWGNAMNGANPATRPGASYLSVEGRSPLRVGTIPARTKDDFPLPEAPTSIRKRGDVTPLSRSKRNESIDYTMCVGGYSNEKESIFRRTNYSNLGRG